MVPNIQENYLGHLLSMEEFKIYLSFHVNLQNFVQRPTQLPQTELLEL